MAREAREQNVRPPEYPGIEISIRADAGKWMVSAYIMGDATRGHRGSVYQDTYEQAIERGMSYARDLMPELLKLRQERLQRAKELVDETVAAIAALETVQITRVTQD